MLVRQVDQRIGLSTAAASALSDPRDPSRITHSLQEMLTQRLYGRLFLTDLHKKYHSPEWGEVFPNAACVVSLIDRLMHRAEVVRIEGDSYRAKEAEEREAQRLAERAAKAGAWRSRKAVR